MPSRNRSARLFYNTLRSRSLNKYLGRPTMILFQDTTFCNQFTNRGGRGFIGNAVSLARYPFPCSFLLSKHLSSLTIECSSSNDFIIRSKSTSVKQMLVNNKIINVCDSPASLIIMILIYQG